MSKWRMILLTLAISGCGSDTVNITLLTPMPLSNPTRNLSETLLVRGGTSNAVVTAITGPSCRQMDLRAGFKAPGWNTRWLPVALDTEITVYNQTELTNQISDFSSRPPGGPSPLAEPTSIFLNQKSALRRPIVIPVPKSVPGEIFLQGMLVEPTDTDGTNNLNFNGEPCAKLNTSALPVPVKTYVVYGSAPFVTTTAGSVDLPINVIQSVRPLAHGTSDSTGYISPQSGAPPINDLNSDFKCKNPNQPRSCSNRGLFQSLISLNVSDQVWIRQPPPPNDDLVSMRIYVANGSTATGDKGVFVFPRESPYLMTYKSVTWRHVLVQYFQGQISYDTPLGRVTQTLRPCVVPPFSFLAGFIPTQANPSPTPASNCSVAGTDYNFAIRDLGQGFN